MPAISAVSNAAGGGAIAAQAWVAISGRNFSTAADTWKQEPLAGSSLPLSVQGVSVSINGIPAFVSSVSPTRVNMLAPSDSLAGTVQVQVTGADGRKATAVVEWQPVAPALFVRSREVPGWSNDPEALLDGLFIPTIAGSNYVLAYHADGTPVARSGALAGPETRPARPGDAINLFGTGFGATLPMALDGQPVAAPLPLANDAVIRFGEVQAGIVSSGLVAPGLYRFTVVVPTVAAGDIALSGEINGVRSGETALLPVVR